MQSRFHLLSIAVVTTCSVICAADLPHDPIHSQLFPPQLLIQHREQIGLTDKQVDQIHAHLEQVGRQTGDYQKQAAEATRKLAELLSVQGIDEPAAGEI